MKLGGFGRIADYDHIQQVGFDYAELDIPEIEALSERKFHVLYEKVQETGFLVLIGSRALPIAEPWFFTEQFQTMKYKAYLRHACQRASILGMKKMILGNGKARWLVDKDSLKKEYRFIDFMRMFAEIAGEYEIEVILEPLSPRYSNYINTLPEAVQIIHKIDMPNLFTMADLRHMFWSEEPFENVITYVDNVHHIHMEYPTSYPKRPFPKLEDDFHYTEFLDVLIKSGYQDTLTIEADIPENWNRSYIDAAAVLKEVL